MEKGIAERYKKLYAGVIYDALSFDLKVKKNFLVCQSVKPAWDFEDVLFGPAFTCKGERVLDESHIDDTVRLKMFQKFYDGCVQVISSGGYREVAEFGDISGKIARKFGAVGKALYYSDQLILWQFPSETNCFYENYASAVCKNKEELVFAFEECDFKATTHNKRDRISSMYYKNPIGAFAACARSILDNELLVKNVDL